MVSNISRLEILIRKIAEELGRDTGDAMRMLISVLKEASDRGRDDHVVELFKSVLLELASETEGQAEFQDYCLTLISRVNQEFLIQLN